MMPENTAFQVDTSQQNENVNKFDGNIQEFNNNKNDRDGQDLEMGYFSAPEECSGLIPSKTSKRSVRHFRLRAPVVADYSSTGETDPGDPMKRSKSFHSLPYYQKTEVEMDKNSKQSTDANGNDKKEKGKSRTLANATFRQKLTLACLSLSNFNMFVCMALMAPFFPQEAERHGVTSTQAGWIFGVFALVQCVTSPFYGKLLPRIGPRFVFLAGNFFTGGCITLFGMLEYFPYNTTLYLVSAFTLRIFLALGDTAVVCAIFAITTSTFPDNPSFVLGLMESAIGFGLMVGPGIGGLIHEVLGFKGPFFVTGGFILFTTIVFHFAMDFSLSVAKESSTNKEDNRSLVNQLLDVPTITVTLISLLVSSMSWVIYDPILEPHLRQFNLSSSAVGGVFLLLAATYAVFAPIVGKIADTLPNSTPVILIGHLVGSTGMLLIGPSPAIGLLGYNKLWLNMIALILMGLSISMTLVPTYDKILDAAGRANIDESFKMHSIVGGLWTSVYAFGEFVGPTLAGWAVSVISFEKFLTYCAAGSASMGIIMGVLWLFEHFQWKKLKLDQAEKMDTG